MMEKCIREVEPLQSYRHSGTEKYHKWIVRFSRWINSRTKDMWTEDKPIKSVQTGTEERMENTTKNLSDIQDRVYETDYFLCSHRPLC